MSLCVLLCFALLFGEKGDPGPNLAAFQVLFGENT
jgi:hypothetical protein